MGNFLFYHQPPLILKSLLSLKPAHSTVYWFDCLKSRGFHDINKISFLTIKVVQSVFAEK